MISSARAHPVTERDLDTAFDVLRAVGQWLERRGCRQRITRTTIDEYRVWQAAGANHAISAGDRIVGVFTVVREPLHEWPDVAAPEVVTWLRALAIHPDHRGAGLGTIAINAAIGAVGPGEHLYLDCVSGFLPDYYARLGFETVATQIRTYPDDGPYDLTLMRRSRDDAIASAGR